MPQMTSNTRNTRLRRRAPRRRRRRRRLRGLRDHLQVPAAAGPRHLFLERLPPTRPSFKVLTSPDPFLDHEIVEHVVVRPAEKRKERRLLVKWSFRVSMHPSAKTARVHVRIQHIRFSAPDRQGFLHPAEFRAPRCKPRPVGQRLADMSCSAMLGAQVNRQGGKKSTTVSRRQGQGRSQGYCSYRSPEPRDSYQWVLH